MKVFKIILITMCCLILTKSEQCQNSDRQFLVTFHPHLDAFWLNTDSELKDINFTPAGFLYAMNQRNSKTILNSMLKSLLEKQTRKYFVTEVVFFKDWYDYINESEKKQVKKLLKNGQLEISNGGWVENDEAVCYYDDILDQYTTGMNFLESQFGYKTKIGWATDSFGHSHSQVALQNLLGIQFQGIQRIDDRYIYLRRQGPLLQFYWQPFSDSNNRSYGGVLTQVRHFLHEVNNLRGKPYGLKSDFSSLETHMLKMYKKNKLFRFLGNDFEEFIPQEFSNLQNTFNELNVVDKPCNQYKYGNPNDYLNLVRQYWLNNELQTRRFDFIPNWDQDRYWVGYYTTDPHLKKDCKDFSRLVNLYRKLLLDSVIQDKSKYNINKPLLKQAEELLAVLQHHDGITATSKTWIQNLFKQRINNASNSILKQLSDVYGEKKTTVCEFYKNNNECNIIETAKVIQLLILHKGGQKNQRIQIKLPNSKYYQLKDYSSQIFCKDNSCKLVFNAYLESGKNIFILQQVDSSKVKINKMLTYKGLEVFKVAKISISIKNGDLFYQFEEGKFIKLGYYDSDANSGPRKTMAWNKYGQRQDKTEYVSSGMYIMFNNGKINQNDYAFKEFSGSAGSNYIKLFIKTTKNTVEVTIDLKSPNVLEWKSQFDPNRKVADYFLKAQSSVDQKQEFYHDSNGYLVAKRKIGWRPDYDWQYKEQDKINANNYPACSFMYIKSKGNKFVTFLDRARGVTLFDGAILTNIERVTGEDGKGVGETYGYTGSHVFTQKFAIVSENNFIERQWQKKYDEPLIGFMSEATITTKKLAKQKEAEQCYYKYTIYFLNENEIVFRIHNLADDKSYNLPQVSSGSLIIKQLGIDLKYKNIRQSFSNGGLLEARTKWTKENYKLSSEKNLLIPLEIKSYRINFLQQINDPKSNNPTTNSKQTQSQINSVKLKSTNHPLRRRCF